MPKLQLWGHPVPSPPPAPGASAGTEDLAAAGRAASRGGKFALALTLMALVALLAAVALAGGLATRRRRQQQRRAHGRWQRLPQEPQQADGLASLVQRARAQAAQRAGTGDEPDSEAAALLALQHNSCLPSGGPAVPAPELVPGRARLKELMQLELASMPRALEVLQPGALPPALVHQLAAGGCSPSPGNSLVLSGGEPSPQQLSCDSGGASARRWGLESDSLRLDPSKLQVGWGRGSMAGHLLLGRPRAEGGL